MSGKEQQGKDKSQVALLRAKIHNVVAVATHSFQCKDSNVHNTEACEYAGLIRVYGDAAFDAFIAAGWKPPS